MYLSKIYRPITANPFRNNIMHTEISPCPALSPYICCYWGTKKAFVQMIIVNQTMIW